MILSAHQGAFLPWLGYFDKIARADLFCIFDVVPLEQGGDYTNRNKIKTPAGAQWLTVPVRRNPEAKYKDIEICADQGWQRKHWRAIELAYAKAPFFKHYAWSLHLLFFNQRDDVREPWVKLADLNAALLKFFLAELRISTPIVKASDYNFRGAKSDLVLDMCKTLGASRYIFGAQGRNYADVPAFEAAGISVEFQDYQHPEYPQLHGAFLPQLSVLDLLLNVGPESAAHLARERRAA